MHWMVPGCVALFTLMLSIQHTSRLSNGFLSTNTVPSLAMVWYGDSLFSSSANWSRGAQPSSARDLNMEWNVFSKTTFEWTNAAGIPSSMGSLSVIKTNF